MIFWLRWLMVMTLDEAEPRDVKLSMDARTKMGWYQDSRQTYIPVSVLRITREYAQL